MGLSPRAGNPDRADQALVVNAFTAPMGDAR